MSTNIFVVLMTWSFGPTANGLKLLSNFTDFMSAYRMLKGGALKLQVLENASMENRSKKGQICKGGKCKYGKIKYRLLLKIRLK